MQNEERPATASQNSAAKEFGPYLVFERLGFGGMAMVHRAKKRGAAGFERGVALKRMLPHLSKDVEFVNSFVREAKLASLLVHPNIAQVHDFGVIDNVYYIAMEHVDGIGVRELLRYCHHSHCLLPISVVYSILWELCGALEYAHTYVAENGQPLGIVHRDVSPSNLMLAPTGHLKVIDFGIARARSRPLETDHGKAEGKLSYMSPEALAGGPVGPPADVFSVGIVAHELLTSRRLFYALTDPDIVHRVREAEILPPSRVNPDVPASLDRVVLAALERDERRRLQSAGAFREALDAVAIEIGIRFSPSEVADWARNAAVNDHKGSRASPPSSTGSAAMRRFPRLAEPSGQHDEHDEHSSDRTSQRLSAASPEPLHGDPLAESGSAPPVPLGSVVRLPSESLPPTSLSAASPSAPQRSGLRALLIIALGLCAIAAGFAVYQFAVRVPAAPAPGLAPPSTSPPRPALVKFIVRPPDSIVEIGNKEVSRQSPFEISLEHGVYSVAVSHSGNKRWTSQITLQAGESQIVNVALEPVTAVIRLTSEPSGLEAQLDGKPTGQVTPAEFEASFGPHRVAVVGATRTWVRELDAAADGPYAFHAVLPTAKRASAVTASGTVRTTPPAPERAPPRASSGNSARVAAAREPVLEPEGRVTEPGSEPTAVKPLAKAESPFLPVLQPDATMPPPPAPPQPAARSGAPLVPATTVTRLSGELPVIQNASGSADVYSKICIGIDGHVTSVKIIKPSAGVAAELQRTLMGWIYRPYVDESGRRAPACFALNFRLVFERAR